MSGNLRWRAGSVAVLLLLFGWITGANFFDKEQRVASELLPDEGLRWGLDLQGGIHWVVGVDLAAALEQESNYLSNALADELSDEGVTPASLEAGKRGLSVEAGNDEDLAKIRQVLEDYTALTETAAVGRRIDLELVPGREQDIRELTMRQVLEVLRRRIDDPVQGIPDSVVTRQGDDRVLVQIPGGQIDRGRARALLEQTAFLEFKIVIDTAGTQELLEAKYPEGIPEDNEIVFQMDPETDNVVAAFLVPKHADITGKYLTDARVGFDNRNRANVPFTFNSEGGRIFGDLTEAHKGERLAIILDQRVYSAPTIQSRITFRGEITGSFTAEEAADLAVVLRAGSLSVPVVIEEERTVGPALGQDSIDSGVRACLVGLLLIVAFVSGYYRLAGGYASIALLANLVLLIGLMSIFEATLTLPGIAGLVLTVGMAVDANVIIFERIREELRDKRSTRAAISTGFNKALWTVLDANITTLITAIVLFQFGTGPIKGFAVTLSIGIVTSVFAALVVTRLLFQIYPGDRPQPLSI